MLKMQSSHILLKEKVSRWGARLREGLGVGCYSKALFLPLPTRNTVCCDAAGTWLNISGF